jgi:aspartyl-tRNA(Asn)/glutamyl-tRNA(Gln) amidotransferase subunit A
MPIGPYLFDPVEIAGQRAGSIRGAWYPYTYPFNLTGHPALSLPCGWTVAGLPIGLQMVGSWGADRFLLDLAAQFERAKPWADRWPPAATQRGPGQA